MKIIRLNTKKKNSNDAANATDLANTISIDSSSAANIASGYISAGKVLILPTSTIYGLSCSYDNKNALEKIYELKQRPGNLPFIVLVSKIDSLLQLVAEINRTADTLIKNYWTDKNSKPYKTSLPLTLIFKKNNSIDSFITRGSKKIAIRLDKLEILKKIIDLSGPIISTSATISGISQSPKNIKEIPEVIKKNADLLIDLCLDLPGIASTIIDVTELEPVLIREGTLKYTKILDKLL